VPDVAASSRRPHTDPLAWHMGSRPMKLGCSRWPYVGSPHMARQRASGQSCCAGGSRDSDHRVRRHTDWSWKVYPPQVRFLDMLPPVTVGATGRSLSRIVTGRRFPKSDPLARTACAGRAKVIGFKHNHARTPMKGSLVSNAPDASAARTTDAGRLIAQRRGRFSLGGLRPQGRAGWRLMAAVLWRHRKSPR